VPNYIGPDRIIEKKQRYMIPCLYHFYERPMQIVKGEMQFLYDSEGNKYLDFYSGVSTINCGHCNPAITERVCEQVKTLQHVSSIYLTQPVVDVAERLAEIAPGKLKRSFFVNSGSEANEGAILLAKVYTHDSEVLALRNSLHGRTQLTISLTGLSFWRTEPNPVGGISFVPNPYCYRCPLNLKYPDCDIACAKEVERVIETSTSRNVAAFIVEPIQGNGGIITPPPEYFKEVKRILDKYGILLIADEVQTGFGRTGKMFCMEHFGVSPDIMSVAKALGNGMPIGAFITTDEIAECFTRPGSSTLGGNPVSMAAALATLDYIEGNDLPGRAARLGDYLRSRLIELKNKHRIIGDVRGLGLMQGAELVHEDRSPAIKEIDIILEKLKDRGVLLGKVGEFRNVLAFQPPLIIEKEDIDQVIETLNEVLVEME